MLTLNEDYTSKIEKAGLYKENDHYYLDITYLLEDERKIVSIHIPKLRIPLEDLRNINLGDPCSFSYDCLVTFGSNVELVAEPCNLKNDEYATVEYTVVKEKPVKMTVEEIEKKLGYKVEIVSKEKSNEN